ncbi:MAG: hypothetical protein KJ880_02130 [Candidatus Omnitrophica bacterium]|nr:hypothetical protein [Candidatus Omnitrophota bacterium]MBU1869643.1 hypothetical protein [Candidatus Omnitrophota bacterium]
MLEKIKLMFQGIGIKKSLNNDHNKQDCGAELKLNLGSNDVRYPGFLNVDIRQIPNVDLVDDVTKLEKISENSASEIIAHNILEHMPYDKTMVCLRLWVSKLKKGGSIIVGVPDGELIFNRYNKGIVTRKQYRNSPWKDVIHSIFGNMELLRQWHGEEAERYMHKTLFCESFLKSCLGEAGIGHIVKVRPNHPDNVTLKGIKL